jgi:uncharacterized protein YxeA
MTSALLKEVVFMLSIGIFVQWEEEFGDAKWIIKIHKSKKDRQHNGQKKKDSGECVNETRYRYGQETMVIYQVR